MKNKKTIKKMKAILSIPEKETMLEFDNIDLSQYRVIGNRPSECGNYRESYPMGKTITMVTSNMPGDLKCEIEDIMKRYCNH